MILLVLVVVLMSWFSESGRGEVVGRREREGEGDASGLINPPSLDPLQLIFLPTTSIHITTHLSGVHPTHPPPSFCARSCPPLLFSQLSLPLPPSLQPNQQTKNTSTTLSQLPTSSWQNSISTSTSSPIFTLFTCVRPTTMRVQGACSFLSFLCFHPPPQRFSPTSSISIR